jgi:Zn finger protein HypA/HybF involved in hydrogenase expression
MSISMDWFASQGRFATYDPFATAASRVAVFQIQCRSCGYEPEDTVVAPKICPKCHSESWERFARPGSILENASRD